MSSLGAYRKTAAAVIGSVLTWAGVAYVPDGAVNRPEWYALALALATALGVYAVTNDDQPQPDRTQPEPIELTRDGSVPLLTRDAHGRFVAPGVTRFSGE